jgi:hypothetical protein
MFNYSMPSMGVCMAQGVKVTGYYKTLIMFMLFGFYLSG